MGQERREVTRVRFTCGELRDIVSIMELLDNKHDDGSISQFTGETVEWHAGDECEGWIEWALMFPI